MPRVIINQMVKENNININLDDEYDTLGFVEEPERFTDIIKIERIVTTKYTIVKVFHRSIEKNTDYKKVGETNNKEEYEEIKKFFKANGYKEL